jgi:hypothetical protein
MNNSKEYIFTPDNNIDDDLNFRTNHLVDFPNINSSNTVVVNERVPTYNCIAWSLGIGGWKWPQPDNIQGFIDLFYIWGFVKCDNGELEPGIEKICLYCYHDEPKHAARQLTNGLWSSKLGSEELIVHDGLFVVEGEFYGYPTLFFSKSRETTETEVDNEIEEIYNQFL